VFVEEAIIVRSARTEDLDADTRASVIRVCVEAHANEYFTNLFTDLPSGSRHALGYHGATLVSHAVVTTRWCSPPVRHD